MMKITGKKRNEILQNKIPTKNNLDELLILYKYD